jgi:hypothetical protein
MWRLLVDGRVCIRKFQSTDFAFEQSDLPMGRFEFPLHGNEDFVHLFDIMLQMGQCHFDSHESIFGGWSIGHKVISRRGQAQEFLSQAASCMPL